MDRTSVQRKAKLTWASACERLSFVLDPPAGAPLDASTDLAAAIAQVRHALQELEAACAPNNQE